jgi:hypothetical protein
VAGLVFTCIASEYQNELPNILVPVLRDGQAKLLSAWPKPWNS